MTPDGVDFSFPPSLSFPFPFPFLSFPFLSFPFLSFPHSLPVPAEPGGADGRRQQPGGAGHLLAGPGSSSRQHPQGDDALLRAHPEGSCQHCQGEGEAQEAPPTPQGGGLLPAQGLAACSAHLPPRRPAGIVKKP